MNTIHWLPIHQEFERLVVNQRDDALSLIQTILERDLFIKPEESAARAVAHFWLGKITQPHDPQKARCCFENVAKCQIPEMTLLAEEELRSCPPEMLTEERTQQLFDASLFNPPALQQIAHSELAPHNANAALRLAYIPPNHQGESAFYQYWYARRAYKTGSVDQKTTAQLLMGRYYLQRRINDFAYLCFKEAYSRGNKCAGYELYLFEKKPEYLVEATASLDYKVRIIARLELGKVHFDRGQYAEAIERFTTVILSPLTTNTFYEACLLRGISRFELGLEEAHNDLNYVFRHATGDLKAEAAYYLARISPDKELDYIGEALKGSAWIQDLAREFQAEIFDNRMGQRLD